MPRRRPSLTRLCYHCPKPIANCMSPFFASPALAAEAFSPCAAKAVSTLQARVRQVARFAKRLALQSAEQRGRSEAAISMRARKSRPQAEVGRTSLYFCRYTLSGSTYSSKPSVLMAHSKSSPLMVLRFSRWHLSLALRDEAASRQRGGARPPGSRACAWRPAGLLRHPGLLPSPGSRVRQVRRASCRPAAGCCAHALAGNEADELRHALLHSLLGVLGDFCIRRQRALHDARDVGDGKVAVWFVRREPCVSHKRKARSPRRANAAAMRRR